MKCLILLLLFKSVFCLSNKQLYCYTIAQEKLYPEVDIVRFCNSYVTIVDGHYCCIKESNQDDVLKQTCLPISQFGHSSKNSATLRPQTFRTKPTSHVEQTRTVTPTLESSWTKKSSSFHVTTKSPVPQTSTESISTTYKVETSLFSDDDPSVTLFETQDYSTDMNNVDENKGGYMPIRKPEEKQTKTDLISGEEDLEVTNLTNKWVDRFQRSIEQASQTFGYGNQDVIVAIFRESIQKFVEELKDTQKDKFCPQTDSLKSESDTFVKTPFDFTLQNIWNAFFYTNEWNPKFTFPNFMIDQQTGILVTVLATLIAAFCDKTTRDRLALLTDELSQISCIEQFCCPSLFHLLKLIFRRAKYPPPRKTLKRKLKHLPKKPDEDNDNDNNNDPNGTNDPNVRNKTKSKKVKRTKATKYRAIYKKKKQPETRINMENVTIDNMSSSAVPQSNPEKPFSRPSSQTNLPDFDTITVVANVHNSGSNRSNSSQC